MASMIHEIGMAADVQIVEDQQRPKSALLLQGELEEELTRSLASFGVDAKSGRMSDARYFAAHAELQRRRAQALEQRPASHGARGAYLHSTILWHINKARTRPYMCLLACYPSMADAHLS